MTPVTQLRPTVHSQAPWSTRALPLRLAQTLSEQRQHLRPSPPCKRASVLSVFILSTGAAPPWRSVTLSSAGSKSAAHAETTPKYAISTIFGKSDPLEVLKGFKDALRPWHCSTTRTSMQLPAIGTSAKASYVARRGGRAHHRFKLGPVCAGGCCLLSLSYPSWLPSTDTRTPVVLVTCFKRCRPNALFAQPCGGSSVVSFSNGPPPLHILIRPLTICRSPRSDMAAPPSSSLGPSCFGQRPSISIFLHHAAAKYMCLPATPV
ncbi:hypothetical protein C8R47DRAFT_219668 [Mycena vitilis]|nr:hypothetical protein C8R47DRAFT_219668 [Mycena vitilis]